MMPVALALLPKEKAHSAKRIKGPCLIRVLFFVSGYREKKQFFHIA